MKTAYIFPGQGSQTTGMGKDLYDSDPDARNIFLLADQVLGFKISDLCFNGPQEELNLTCNTQPALLTVSAALATVLRKKLREDVTCVAGHSLGEYSALWFSGAFTFETAVQLVRTRGELMQSATPPGIGAMAAVMGLEKEDLVTICNESAQGQILETANFNGPGQIVISGNKEAVDRAMIAAKTKGAKRSILLPVSAPFHCELMKPAAVKMAERLAKSQITAFNIPLVNNADAQFLKNDRASIENSLTRQMTSSVKWEQSIRFMEKQGVKKFVEIGAGRVLTNLVKRIAPESECIAVGDLSGLNSYIGQAA